MALIVKKKSLDREALASHINDTAFIVETGVVNVIMAASVSARVYGESSANDTHLLLNNTKEKVILFRGLMTKNNHIGIVKGNTASAAREVKDWKAAEILP